MKIKRYYSLVCLVLVSCFSSTKKEDLKTAKKFTELIRNETVFVVDIDNTPKEKALYLSDYFKNVQTIALEDVENGLIGRISKLIVFNEYIFILDSSIAHCLFVFNREGKFIRKIGSIGKGPGEYINLSDFTIDLDHNIIYVLDSHIQKISSYDLFSGEYIHSIRIKNDYVRSYHIQYVDGKLYADAFFPVKSENNFILRTLGLSTGEQDSCWMSVNKYNKGWDELYFDRHNLFISNTSFARFNRIFMDTVVSVTSQGVIPYLAIKSKKLLTQKDLLETAGKMADERLSALMGIDKIHGIKHYLEFGKYIHFEYQRRNSLFPVLFNKETGKAQMADAFIDDLVFTKDFIHTILPAFYYADSSRVYGVLPNHAINRFLQLTKDGYLSEKMKLKDNLMKLTQESNPVIFCYEYKE